MKISVRYILQSNGFAGFVLLEKAIEMSRYQGKESKISLDFWSCTAVRAT